ncbi:acyltransferase family protein [Arthrobacter sp. JSM 101049]|uniref:acyltransferase family protein n=1 Tax=Arthrobacter sp. JSM 101049 TaxID=929097 RepID=UPI0035682699
MIHLRTRRDPVLDAAKGFLIILVVLGHLLARTDPSAAVATHALITGIYAFHMPAFVFLAGITSKPSGIGRRCAQFLTLLAVFQVAYFLAKHLLGSDESFPWVTPAWLLWFLLSMTFWTLLTPVIVRFPRASLALSVAVSLGAGMVDAVGYPFSLSRTLVFLPFFVAGFTHGRKVLARVAGLGLRGRAVVAGAALAVFAGLLTWSPDHNWFFGSKGFDVLEVSDLSGVAHRAVLTAGLLVLMPRKPTLLNRFGQRSLSIYLLHGFVVLLAAPYVLVMAKDNVWLAVVMLGFLTAGIAVLASMQPVHETIGRIGAICMPLVERLGGAAHASGTDSATAAVGSGDAASQRATVGAGSPHR